MIFAKLCQAPSVTASQVSRLAGSDRYATAAAISRDTFAAGVSVTYVATGQNFPDALAGAPAAAKANAPILLVTRDSVPAATATELRRLKPARIVVLGSSGVVGSGVARTLDGLTAGSVSRLAGSDRYATAAAISRATFGAGVAVVYIATGQNFPDALGGGAAAGHQKGPVLLTPASSLPSVTATELSRLRPARIVILGASGVVSSHVADQLRHYSSNVSRLSGDDRYATAVSVSRSTYGSAGADTVFVATGTKFPDGLAGGPTAAITPGPLLLVQPNALPSEVATELRRLDPGKVIVLGSSGVVSDAVVSAIDAALP
jgi:putative cell wall-binding protein